MGKGKGGFGGMPGNMQALVKQAQKMQEDLAKAQEQSEELTAEGSSGGGMVVAVANGKNQIASLQIDKSVIDPEDAEMLQDMVLAAINEALRNVQEQVKNNLGQVTGGIDIPGLF